MPVDRSQLPALPGKPDWYLDNAPRAVDEVHVVAIERDIPAARDPAQERPQRVELSVLLRSDKLREYNVSVGEVAAVVGHSGRLVEPGDATSRGVESDDRCRQLCVPPNVLDSRELRRRGRSR